MYSDLLIIALAGGFGGLVYGLQTGSLSVPHYLTKERKLHLGFLANCLFGIAGAIVIFLIVPGDFDFSPDGQYFIKSLATAIVGGWGGLAIVERVYSSSVNDLQAKIEAQENQTIFDGKAIDKVTEFLNTNTQQNVPIDTVINAVKEASPIAQAEMLNEAQRVRSENWFDNKPKMERTIAVFKGLCQSKQMEDSHRVHGQLGFALKDSLDPNYIEAKEHLDKAIQLRNNEDIEGFAWYEFNRAICSIHLDADFVSHKRPTTAEKQQQIVSDLKTAFSDTHVLRTIEENATKAGGDKEIIAIQEWLTTNRIPPSEVKAGWLQAAA